MRRTTGSRAIGAEMLIAGEPLLHRLAHHAAEEALDDPELRQPRPVAREGGGVEDVHRRIHVQEPAEERVGVDPFDQLRFGADRVQRLQEQCLEQPLGRPPRSAGA